MSVENQRLNCLLSLWALALEWGVNRRGHASGPNSPDLNEILYSSVDVLCVSLAYFFPPYIYLVSPGVNWVALNSRL